MQALLHGGRAPLGTSSGTPLSEPIIEDENHVLLTCPLYEDLRQQLLPATRNPLENDFESIFENAWTIRDIGNYISKIFERRQLTYVDS